MGEETSKKRLDRELIELLNELRILLPGVQFLLTAPFNTGFSKRHDVPRSKLFPISGVLLLAVAIVVSMLLVVDYLFQVLLASICAGLVAAVLVSAWLVQPIIQRGRLQLDELFDPDQPDG